MKPIPATDAEGRTTDASTLIAEIDGELVEAIARRVVDLLKPELAGSERDRLATAPELSAEVGEEPNFHEFASRRLTRRSTSCAKQL
jgi:hypothetical protein